VLLVLLIQRTQFFGLALLLVHAGFERGDMKLFQTVATLYQSTYSLTLEVLDDACKNYRRVISTFYLPFKASVIPVDIFL
jgi:hypothetical protein